MKTKKSDARAQFRKKNYINMTVLYVMVAIVFLLVSALNIYAYRAVSSTGSSLADQGTLTGDFRRTFQKAYKTLLEIVEPPAVSADSKQKKEPKTLEKDLLPLIKRLNRYTADLKRLDQNLSVTLDKNVTEFYEGARKAFSLTSKTKTAELRAQLAKSLRIVQLSDESIENFNSSLRDVVRNEMQFIRTVYIVLILANVFAFAAIFFVIFVNAQNIKTKERLLHASNANFLAIMHGLDCILFTITKDGIIRSWNTNAVRYFDIPEKDAVGNNIYELIPPLKAYQEFFNRVLYSQQRHFLYHDRMHINKGPMRDANILCVPIVASSGNKDISELLVKIDDVTTFTQEDNFKFRKRNAVLLSTAMNRVVQESSELNTYAGEMIQSISAWAQENGLGDQLIPYTASLGNTMTQLGMIPQKYVSSLAVKEPVRESLDLNEVIMYALRICQKTFDAGTNIEVSLNESKSLVSADAGQLSKALFCLLNNAAESVAEQREGQHNIIAVSVERMSGEQIACDRIMRFRHAVKEPPYWIILISDNGDGIPEEIQNSIFDPFFTTKDPAQHKGIGLSVAVNAINAIGGYIDFNTKKGHGTVFKIYLPELENMDSGATAASSSLEFSEKDLIQGSGNVLLIDNDLCLRGLVKKLIEGFGYTVYDADNSFAALELYQQNADAISCVLLDAESENFGNKELFESLKAVNPAVSAAVLVDSDTEESTAELRSAGITHFIRKPCQVPDLAKLLYELTSQA